MTIDWPAGAYGQPLPIETAVNCAMVFKDGRQCRPRGVRALSGRRGLARPLSRFRRRAHAAHDAGPASGAVLAGPGRSAPHASAMQLLPGRAPSTGIPLSICGTAMWLTRGSGRRRSTGSLPRGSAPNRRSTRRSPASSRSRASKPDLSHPCPAASRRVVISMSVLRCGPGGRRGAGGHPGAALLSRRHLPLDLDR